MRTIKIGNIISRAWNLSINNWPIFILMAILTQAVGYLGTSVDAELLNEYNIDKHPELLLTAFEQAFHINPFWLIVNFLLTTYLTIVTYKMLVNCARTGKPYESMADVFRIDFMGFAFYLGVAIMMGLAIGVVIGLGVGVGVFLTAPLFKYAEFAFGLQVLVAIIIMLLACFPAIYLSVRWSFAPIIIATEKVPLLDAFRISWRITRGNFWKIVLLAFASVGVIILGLCACCVGVILAIVVVKFMFTLAYTDLRDAQEEEPELGSAYVK